MVGSSLVSSGEQERLVNYSWTTHKTPRCPRGPGAVSNSILLTSATWTSA